jgi:hypothetical protein
MLARQKGDVWLLSSPFTSGCSPLAGSASMSMSRAMIASAYIRQMSALVDNVARMNRAPSVSVGIEQ